MSKQDRQGSRTPADLERKYNFAEVREVATNAEVRANEAIKAASEITASGEGLSLKVSALERETKAQLDLKVGMDSEGNLASKIHVGADKLTIDTGNFQLTEQGMVKSISDNTSVALENGVTKLNAPTVAVSSGGATSRFVPLIEFKYTDENGAVSTKSLVAECSNGQWTLKVANGTFSDLFANPTGL